MSVLTFAHWTSYIAFTASLIFSLVARMSTRKTKVLISSIFFMADSVVRGHFMIAYLSILFRRCTDFRGYFGSRLLMSVLGKKKCTFVRTLDFFRLMLCFTALATFPAFLPPLAGAAPSSALGAFGAMSRLQGLWNWIDDLYYA